MQTFDQMLDAKYARRERGYDRKLDILARQEEAAVQMVGTLCREGKTVHYVAPVGGKYKEGSKFDLVAYLIRNGYVR
jgi:hypothetical protein